MKENKKLILAIVVVLAIIIAVFGATYAYWTWVSNSAQNTTVSFTTSAPSADMYANLTGNGAGTTNLKPSTCTNGIKKTVTITYKNNTVQAATISATLKVTSFKFRTTSYRPTGGDSGDLKYIKYALTTSSTACDSGVQKNGDFRGLTIPTSGTATVASSLPYTLFTQTIPVNANVATEQSTTYYLYIWLDSSYTHENEGNENSDPLQGLAFTTEWSGTIAQNNS